MTIRQLRNGKWSGIVMNTLKGMSDDRALEVFGKCQSEFEVQNACWAYWGFGHRRTRKTYGVSLDPVVYEFWRGKAIESDMSISACINEVLCKGMLNSKYGVNSNV